MQEGSCRAFSRALVLCVLCASGACGDSATAASQSKLSCPTFAAGVTVPTRIETTHARIAGITELQLVPWIDESGIYWFDHAGALYALPHGQTTPVMLRPASAAPIQLLRLVGDDTHLFWGEANEPPPGPPDPSPPPPPGRLYAIAKAGGAAKLVLEAATELLTPIAVADDRVIVRRSSVSSGLTALAKDGSSSRALTTNTSAEPGSVIDGKLYWSVPDPNNSDVNGYFHDFSLSGRGLIAIDKP